MDATYRGTRYYCYNEIIEASRVVVVFAMGRDNRASERILYISLCIYQRHPIGLSTSGSICGPRITHESRHKLNVATRN